MGQFPLDGLRAQLCRLGLASHLNALNRHASETDQEQTGNWHELVDLTDRQYKPSKPCVRLSLRQCGATLRVFDAAKCSLRQFRVSLPHLEVLNLAGNRLAELSGAYLPRLVHLDVSENRFASFDRSPHLPWCHYLNISGNQLIQLDQLHQQLPRLVELQAAENFLVAMAKLAYVSVVNMSNNSLEQIKLCSLFVTHLDVSFNSIEASSDQEPLITPLMETDGLQWNDHVSQFTEQPCPISFNGSDEFTRFLKLNNYHHIVGLITKLKSLQAPEDDRFWSN